MGNPKVRRSARFIQQKVVQGVNHRPNGKVGHEMKRLRQKVDQTWRDGSMYNYLPEMALMSKEEMAKREKRLNLSNASEAKRAYDINQARQYCNRQRYRHKFKGYYNKIHYDRCIDGWMMKLYPRLTLSKPSKVRKTFIAAVKDIGEADAVQCVQKILKERQDFLMQQIRQALDAERDPWPSRKSHSRDLEEVVEAQLGYIPKYMQGGCLIPEI